MSRFLTLLDTISPLLLILFIVWQIKLNPKRDRIFQYILLQLVLNGLALLIDLLSELPNLYLYHLNCYLSVTLLSGFFKETLQTKVIKRAVMPLLYIQYALFLINFCFLENFSSFPSIAYSMISLIIVAYALIFFLENLIRANLVDISKIREFWHVTGLLTYYTTSFFIFISYSSLTETLTENLYVLWLIHNVVFFIMCVYFLVGYLCRPLLENFR